MHQMPFFDPAVAHRKTFMSTSIEPTGERLITLLMRALHDSTVDRSAITQAAVALMDADRTDTDDRITADLADSLAEKAALWVFGEDDPKFRRPGDRLKLETAIKSCLLDRLIQAL
jgi:hypothetical protein